MRQQGKVQKPGDWLANCDYCGWTFFASELREDWKGLYACKQDYSPRHPQDFVRGVADDPSVPFVRKETIDDGVTFVSDSNFTVTTSTDNLIVYEDALTANRTVTLSTTDFIKGDRAKVVKKDSTAFTIDVGGVQTLTADSTLVVEFDGSAWNKESFHTFPL